MSESPVALHAKVITSGAFFERDPAKTMRQNIRAMLKELVREGEADVKMNYPVLTGAGRAGVRGRVESLSGKPWLLTGVVSQTHVYPWPSGGPKQYRGGKSEARYHMFRRAAARMRASRAVLNAKLTQGME